ncbi:MAG: hypothetical protein HW390_1571 [Candidatus Brocadiaceae bacterium]|nr:hypothetical protein [Candidatus Brocadiaceae bacterium]
MSNIAKTKKIATFFSKIKEHWKGNRKKQCGIIGEIGEFSHERKKRGVGVVFQRGVKEKNKIRG